MLQLALTIIIFLIIVIPVGRYMYHIATWNHTLADPVFDRLDGVIYKIGGVNPHQGMNWRQYALALVGTNAVMVAIGYLILRIQSVGIFNPNSIGNMEPTLAFNTIISFMTNTNLQHYSGESGLSYLSQMLVIIFMMFVSAASGYAACIAFIRGLTGKTKDDVGNFFADLTRITTRLLLPFSIVGGLLLVWQGVPQNFDANIVVNTLEGTFQTIAMGPIAALEIIKHLGTNGGGFLGANSTTPLENPTIISDMIELYSMMLFPGACVITFGKMVRGRKKKDAAGDKALAGSESAGQLSAGGAEQGPRLKDHSLTASIYGWEGRTIFLAMGIIFLVGLGVCYWSELQGNPRPGSVRGQQGGQGGPVRHRPVGHVHHHHDLFHHRHRQQHARYPDASGRHDPLAAHDAERGLRRQGRRPDEHDYVRHPGSVHLWPDDWPYARIPGQEDRGPGDEAHRAVHHHPSLPDPVLLRAGGLHLRRPGGNHQPGLPRPEPGAV